MGAKSFNTRTLLVDGAYLFKRAFSQIEKHGHEWVIYSFITTLRKMIREEIINKVIVCWDGENSGQYRYEIYKGYKAQRQGKIYNKTIDLTDSQINFLNKTKDNELYIRMRIKSYLEELFIRQIEFENVEGDDLIAGYCKLFHNDEKITIFTNDRDYCQLLIYKNVEIYIDNKKIKCTKENFDKHFGYTYKNSLLLKTICGDNSDNIKGVVGMKETTLMKHFPKLKNKEYTIELLLEESEIIQKERKENKLDELKVLNNLKNSKELLELNHKLMNLNQPFLEQEHWDGLNEIQSIALDDSDRNSKNLLKLITKDNFLSFYQADFKSYVIDFYSVILTEKEYLKNKRN